MEKLRLNELCHAKLAEKGLERKYLIRLEIELKEIEVQNKADYVLGLYDKNIKYKENEHNLIVYWLLGIAPDFDITDLDSEKSWRPGELPDIDSDYHKDVQKYLKLEWAPKRFGRNYVANIGTYGTYGLKSSLAAMARVFGKELDEVRLVTKNINDKDDEGKPMTWDKAFKISPGLAEYCEKYPDVTAAAQRLINRNCNMGTHAAGLIISSKPINDFVPIVVDKLGNHVSAWVEGLHGTDLQPVGLIKFDLLVITNLQQLGKCLDLVKKRHNLTSICAIPGGDDWSDTSYLNDPLALAAANKGDLKCIFQFDSSGIRNLAKMGGIDSFDDIFAYASIYRPGPLGAGMGNTYTNRKRGREEYEIHPLMEPVLASTYGVMCYQEQVMRILNLVGGIPLKDCEAVRKAISKKKVEKFLMYKQQFIDNGQKNLNQSAEDLEILWGQIETFADYGFNASHAVCYSYLSARLLYLKVHYPLEFYAAILSCETDSKKIKEYKTEVMVHNMDITPVDINKSKVDCEIVDEEIYYGIANIKGVGPDEAAKIVAGQPYESFTDFLERATTDATVVKPLIALRAFKDADPFKLYAYYEYFKGCVKKQQDRVKRFETNMKNLQIKLQGLLPGLEEFALFEQKYFDMWKERFNQDEERFEEIPNPDYCEVYEEDLEAEPVFDDERGLTEEQKELIKDEFDRFPEKYREVYRRPTKCSVVDPAIPKTILKKKKFNRWKELEKVWLRYHDLIKKQHLKEKLAEKLYLPLKDFDVEGEINIKDDYRKFLIDEEEAQKNYYGFQWIHELEKSPDYEGGKTFEQFRQDVEDLNVSVSSVEVIINEVKLIKKEEKTPYYNVIAEDSNGETAILRLWTNEMTRWKEEMQVGNLLKVRIKPPMFGAHNIDSPPRDKLWTLPKNKAEDYRIIRMRKAYGGY